MSNISATFVVDTNPIQVQVQQSNVNVSVEPVSLNVLAGGVVLAGGNLGELQFNNGTLGGVPNTNFDGNNLSLGNVANVKILGGTNGYVLQTDGTGNLSWSATGGGGGNGVPGGANTQVQFNDEGVFGGVVGFTFDKVTGDLDVPGIVSGDGSGLSNISAANVIGTFESLSVTPGGANINALTTGFIQLNGNMNSTGTVVAGFFNGSGNQLFNLNGANVVNAVANATFANTANIANTATFANTANIANTANTATFAVSANTAQTVTANSQPNITSVGNLTSLIVTGNLDANTVVANVLRVNEDSIILGSNSESSLANAQNVVIGKSAGENSANVIRSVFIGNTAGESCSGNSLIGIGQSALSNATGNYSIGIGEDAVQDSSGFGIIGIGFKSKSIGAGNTAIGIGFRAGETNGGIGSIAIGARAGQTNQGNDAIAIGSDSATNNQGRNAIAIGFDAGGADQGANSIAIGMQAGLSETAPRSIVMNVGAIASVRTEQENTIAINASNDASGIVANIANALYVKPIRTVSDNTGLKQLYYNPTTGEIVFYDP